MVSCTVKVKITWLCLAFCDSMDCSPRNFPDQNTRVVAFPFSRGSSQPRDQTQVSCLAGGFFTSWATRKALWSEVKMLVTQLCLTLCDPHGPPWAAACQAPLSMGFFQARKLEWVAISFSRASLWPRNQTWVCSIADGSSESSGKL